MTSERRRLLAGTTWTLASTVVSMAVGITLRPVLVLYIGIDGYGIWAAALAITSLFGVLGDLGVGAALTRMVAERDGRGVALGTLAGSALLFGLLAGVLSGLVLVVLAGPMERIFAFPGFAVLLQIQAVQMPINLGTASLMGLLQGRRSFRGLALFTTAQAAGNLALAVSLLSLGLGLVGVMLSSLATSAVIFGAALARSRNGLRFGGLAAIGNDLRGLFPFGAQLTATNALSTMLYQIDVVVLSLLVADPTIVGTYALAVFVTRTLWILPGSINVTTYPVVSKYSATHDGKRVGTYLSTALVASVAITGALASGLVLFGRPLLGFLFSPSAVAAYELCLVLLMGTAALGSLRSVASSIPAVGRPDVGMWISALGASMVFGLSLALTPAWGVLGTALGVSVSFSAVAGALVWAINRHVLSRDRGRWNAKRIGLTALVSTAIAASTLLGSLPEGVTVDRVLLSLGAWVVAVVVLGLASGGKETWGGVLRRTEASALGRD